MANTPSQNGFVLVHRSIVGHPAFRDASEEYAFIKLIMQASWQPVTVRYKGRVISLRRGELALSIRDLARGNGWRKNKAERFLESLKKQDMLRTVGDQKTGHLTICNYDEYQLSPDRDRTPRAEKAGHVADTLRTQNNKTNQVKEEKKESLYTPNFLRWYANYPHKVGKGAALKAFNKAERKVDIETLIAGVLRYVEMKPPDRSWCNPATWLNEERWSDEYAAVDERRSGHQAEADAFAQAVRNLNSREGRSCDVSANGGGDARTDIQLLGCDEGLDEASEQ